MLNPIYTYLLNIYNSLMYSLLVTFFKQARAHLFAHSQMVSSIANTNSSICHS